MSGTDVGRRRDDAAPAGGEPVAAVRSRLWPPVLVFYLVALAAAGLLAAIQPLTGLDEQILSLTQFGPTIAVGVVLLGFPSLRSTVAAAVRGSVGSGGRHLALVSATAFAIFAGCLGIYAVLGRDAAILRPSALVAPLALIVPAQLVGACGEELGWRCLLQPLFRSRSGPLAASMAVGLMWGLWHVQVLVAGPSFAAAFLVSAVALSVIMGLAIHSASGHNLLIAAGFHLLVNLGLLLLLDEEDGDATAMWVFAGVAVLSACGWALGVRRSITAAGVR